jgi:hypothetical protein
MLPLQAYMKIKLAVIYHFDIIVFKVPGQHPSTLKRRQGAMLDRPGLSTALIVFDVSVS